MVHINFAALEVSCKIVYYGPAFGGKAANIEWLYAKAPQTSKGKLVTIATETEPTLFFDFLPVDLGQIGGMRIKLLLYTVPGQIIYQATRKLVLHGADGVVFVADSNPDLRDDNIDSLDDLAENLAENELNLADMPLVFQFNKRRLKNAMSVEKMNADLNPSGLPFHKANAEEGKGVGPTLMEVANLVIKKLNREQGYAEDGKARLPGQPFFPQAPVPGATAARPMPPLVTEAELLGSVGKSLPCNDAGRPVCGEYELLELLAATGMAVVFRARPTDGGAEVVVKMLSVIASHTDEVVDHFLREAGLAARIRHPHLVRVVQDAREDESGLYYMVLELVDGPDAGKRLAQVATPGTPGLEEREALEIVTAATRGLKALHDYSDHGENGVIHRDVKPSNIFIPRSADGGILQPSRAKLGDFGVAKPRDATVITKAGTLVCSIGYSPPEQYVANMATTLAADVFSMGATLYCLLAGRPPFAGRLDEAMFNTIFRPHPPLKGLRADASDTTVELVDRCLLKDPTARYRDAAELLEALLALGQ